ncbi:HNH endonuclease [filamentous cyanobacterium LEGE 11480]|uniref:HNH endonuclease n=1 Tax=Romeriopsis navalis LEGE 11480 TaxID=2777977 RepID=A0A928VLH2_9CYAN|nr:HNH endonuclease [Romeriopsis navalis]MBE9030793.1 HNH endonuclease [Romeriopsis navalis LEGE 11480]
MEYFTSQEYAEALANIELTQGQKSLLDFHYQYQVKTKKPATCPNLAAAVGYKNHGGVNGAYGNLGKKILNYLGYSISSSPATIVVKWFRPEGDRSYWLCELHPELMEVLKNQKESENNKGLKSPSTQCSVLKDFPDEVNPSEEFYEGAVSQVQVNAYERNPQARRKCIEHYGASCCVCSFQFSSVLGERGDGFIHVHHLHPISKIAQEYQVDPINDLRPVCPNCHAMIHRYSPPLTINQLKEKFRAADLPVASKECF